MTKLKSLKSGLGIHPLSGVTIPDRGKEFDVERQYADVLVAIGYAEFADSEDVRKKVLGPAPAIETPPGRK